MPQKEDDGQEVVEQGVAVGIWQRRKERRSKISDYANIIGALAGILAFVLAGWVAIKQFDPGLLDWFNAPNQSSVLRTCANAAGGYQVGCLSNWPRTTTTIAGEPEMVITSPDNQDSVTIVPFDPTVQPQGYHDALTNFLIGIDTDPSAPAPTVNTSTTTAKVGHYSWTIITGTYTQNSVVYQAQAYGTDHDGKTFFIVATAPSTAFNSANATFQQMLQMFTFTN